MRGEGFSGSSGGEQGSRNPPRWTRLLELIKIRKEPGEGAPEHLGVLGEQLSTVQPQALVGHPCPGGEGRPPQSHEAPLTSFQEGTGGPLKRAVNPPESHL